MSLQQEYWNERFASEGAIWGMDACKAAICSEKVFRENNVYSILVPGCAYGRNSLYLASKGFNVLAFDISEEAIKIAQKELETKGDYPIKYRHGNILEVNIEQHFDGILSINLLHLFNREEAEKILSRFHELLNVDGVLVLTSMSTNDADYGKGTKIDDYTFESKKGRPIHYYDKDSMRELISRFFVVDEIEEIEEYENHGGKEHYHNMIYVVARKVKT